MASESFIKDLFRGSLMTFFRVIAVGFAIIIVILAFSLLQQLLFQIMSGNKIHSLLLRQHSSRLTSAALSVLTA